MVLNPHSRTPYPFGPRDPFGGHIRPQQLGSEFVVSKLHPRTLEPVHEHLKLIVRVPSPLIPAWDCQIEPGNIAANKAELSVAESQYEFFNRKGFQNDVY
jgi:hypothetical protein